MGDLFPARSYRKKHRDGSVSNRNTHAGRLFHRPCYNPTMRTLIATLIALMLFATTPVAAGNDDNKILKRLDAIEKRLSKIEKAIDAGADAQQLEALKALKNMFKGSKSTKKGGKTEKSKLHNYLVVTKWSAGDGGEDFIGQQVVEVYYTMKNMTKKTISIIDGHVVFKDKLGETIGRLRIERDVDLSPNEEKPLGGRYTQSFGTGLERLIVINNKHVDVSVDMDKLLFSDGEVVKF